MGKCLRVERQVWCYVIGGIILALLILRISMYFVVLHKFGLLGGDESKNVGNQETSTTSSSGNPNARSNSKPNNNSGPTATSHDPSTATATTEIPSEGLNWAVFLIICIILQILAVIQFAFTIIMIVGAYKMSLCLLTVWFFAAIIFCIEDLVDISCFSFYKIQFLYFSVPPFLLLLTLLGMFVVFQLRSEIIDSIEEANFANSSTKPPSKLAEVDKNKRDESKSNELPAHSKF